MLIFLSSSPRVATNKTVENTNEYFILSGICACGSPSLALCCTELWRTFPVVPSPQKDMYNMHFSFKYYRASQIIRQNLWQGQPVHCCLMRSRASRMTSIASWKVGSCLAAAPLSGEKESPGLLKFDIKWTCFCLFVQNKTHLTFFKSNLHMIFY